MARATRKISLNINLLKNGNEIIHPENFIRDYQEENKREIHLDGAPAFLYSKPTFPFFPDWLTDLNEKILSSPIENFNPKNQTSGATLFIEVSSRIFAINFGTQGRWNIEKEQIEDFFGLYTSNKFLLSDPDNIKLKSSQSRIHETNPVNKKTQYGDEITSNTVRTLLQDNEALKELSLMAKKHPHFPRMTGKIQALSVQISRDDTNHPFISIIPDKFGQLLNLYNSVTKEDIKKLFKDIYPLRNTDTEYTELNRILPKRLASKQNSFSLFEPEIDFDLSMVSTFRIIAGHNTESYEELHFSHYLQLRENPTLNNLKEDKIEIIDVDNRTITEWTVFECQYGEIQFNNTNYILSGKQWYEVNPNKYQRVNEKYNSVLDTSYTVPDAVREQSQNEITAAINTRTSSNTKIYKERIFNKILCSDLNGELFDESGKQITLYDDRFEVCDILCQRGNVSEFIHVKYNSGADAISHLTNQGFVSAKSYVDFTGNYIHKVNEHIGEQTHKLQTRHQGSIIRYLIINDKTENKLTFFSEMQMEKE